MGYQSIFKAGLFAGQTIIVTGGGSGIGRCIAHELASLGAVLALVGRKIEKLESVQAEIAAAAPQAKVTIHTCDIRDEPGVKQMITDVLAAHGRIDGLVNNAAYFREVKLTEFEQIDPAVWDRIFQVNVKGVWNCCKAVMPAMRERKSGSIVNIASVVAVAGQPGYLHYVASKGAVLSMTKGLAKEVGQHGVRVNVIAPGFVITDATKNRPAEWQQSFLKARAISREQRPDDLVGTALYLLSDLAGFVSGQTVVVDGGHIMY